MRGVGGLHEQGLQGMEEAGVRGQRRCLPVLGPQGFMVVAGGRLERQPGPLQGHRLLFGGFGGNGRTSGERSERSDLGVKGSF